MGIININKSEHSQNKPHLFKEKNSFLIMSHDLNSILLPSNILVFKTHIPPSTISHMSYLLYHFLKPLVKEKSLKGAIYTKQWTSKLRLITTILFVLLFCYQLLTVKSVKYLDKMSFIYILI